MNKTIAIKCSQNLGVNAHGAETHTTISFVKYFKSAGYNVILVGPEVYPDELRGETICTYFKYNNYPKVLRKLLHIPVSIYNLLVFLLFNKPDIVLTVGGVFYNGLAVSILCKIFSIKSLVRTAEDNFSYHKYFKSSLVRFKYYIFNSCLSRFVFKLADNILTVGDESKKYFIDEGVPEKKISGIPGPFIRSRFYKIIDFQSLDFKKQYSIPDNKKIILYVGALSGVKGANYISQIMENVFSCSDAYYFIVIGSDTEGGVVLDSLSKFSKDKLLILEPQTHDVLCKFYNLSDVLIFLTRVGVGYGQVNIEATLCGLPVLALDAGVDLRWFLKDACCASVDEMVGRILSNKYRVVSLPKEFDDSYIEEKHLNLISNILSN